MVGARGVSLVDRSLLRLEASAEEFLLQRRGEELWLRRELYVNGEQSELTVRSLEEVLNLLRDTALPFCEVTWLVPKEERPAGHERLAEQVAVLVDDFRDHAATVRFTV